jgi:hypothetical protein
MLAWNNERRMSDLALALPEDDNGQYDGDAHAEYLDAKHHSTQQVVVWRHARGVPAAHVAAFGARHTPEQENAPSLLVPQTLNVLKQ